MDGNRTAGLLATYLASCTERPVPFSWAAHHCCHFAAGWVRSAGRADPMRSLPPTPDARSALRLVASLGGGLEQAVTRRLGCEPIAAAFAQTGDVLLLPTPARMRLAGPGTGFVAGVCSGRHAVLQAACGALVFAPLEVAVCAWRLPPEVPA